MKRTKKYRPRAVNTNAMEWAMAGACTLPASKQAELISYVDHALDVLRQGRADRDVWNGLANAMNIAEALIHFQIGTNLAEQIAAAHAALHGIALRMLKTGSATCYAAELAAVTEGRDLYRIQLSLCSQAEMMRAVQRVTDLHRSGAMQDVAVLYDRMAENNPTATQKEEGR